MNPVVVLLAVTAASAGLAMRSVEPMLPLFASEFSVPVPVAAQVITVFALFYAFSQLVHGPLGDRYGKLRIIIVMTFLSSAAFVGCAFADDLAALTIWRAVSGTTSSALFILGMAYIGDTVAVERRQTTVAQYALGNAVGHASGPLLSGIVTDAFGWRAMFVVLTGIFLAVGLAMLVLTRTYRRAERSVRSTSNPVRRYVDVLKLPKVRVFILVSMTEAFFFFGAYAYLGALLKERFDLSFTLIGLALAGFGIGGLIFNGSIRWMIRQMSPRRLVIWGGCLCGLMYVTVALLPVSGPIYALMIGIGFTFYMLHNVVQTRATEAAPQARGTGLSLFGVSWSVGQSLGVAAMGLGISAVGIGPMVAVFGVGFAALSIWMRFNMHRMP
jgi:MFS transporter, YNFM family, putative membrane transport protein